MALIIELGAPTANANTFIDEAYLAAYTADRGYTITETIEPLLIRSFDLMASLPWCEPHAAALTVVDAHKSAQAEIAYRFSQGYDPFKQEQTAVQLKSKQVDVLKKEFYEAKTVSAVTPESALESMPQAAALLKSLLCGTTSKAQSGYIGRA